MFDTQKHQTLWKTLEQYAVVHISGHCVTANVDFGCARSVHNLYTLVKEAGPHAVLEAIRYSPFLSVIGFASAFNQSAITKGNENYRWALLEMAGEMTEAEYIYFYDPFLLMPIPCYTTLEAELKADTSLFTLGRHENLVKGAPALAEMIEGYATAKLIEIALDPEPTEGNMDWVLTWFQHIHDILEPPQIIALLDKLHTAQFNCLGSCHLALSNLNHKNFDTATVEAGVKLRKTLETRWYNDYPNTNLIEVYPSTDAANVTISDTIVQIAFDPSTSTYMDVLADFGIAEGSIVSLHVTDDTLADIPDTLRYLEGVGVTHVALYAPTVPDNLSHLRFDGTLIHDRVGLLDYSLF